MNFERALEIANQAMSERIGRPLSDVETAILRGSWNNFTYEQIAENAGYSISYLTRDVGPKFWKLLSQSLEQPVSKTNFRVALERRSRERDGGAARQQDRQPTQGRPSGTMVAQTAVLDRVACRCDWGEAVDVSFFYGRREELETLQQWIVGDASGELGCRLVALLGMGGIGKTSLAVKLAQTLIAEAETPVRPFQYVIWRSLRHAPPLELLLSELISFFSNQEETGASLSRLMHWLRTHRCLVILDNVETLLQAGDRAGQYRPGYEAYGELFRVVGEAAHQSCLILTSREKPAELAMLEGIELLVRSLSLSGLQEAAAEILTAKGLLGSADEKLQLVNLYGGNPLALKIVSTSIQDLFDGEIDLFLNQDATTVFNGIQKLLDQQYERCSPLEKKIMYWLAINREWTAIAELTDDIVPPVPKAELMNALESLSWRSMIEKQPGKYTQQPVVMEYITNRLIEQVSEELIGDPAVTLRLAAAPLFQTYALLKTTAKDYVNESQTQLILKGIANKVCMSLGGSKRAVEQQMQRILQQWQSQEKLGFGYGCGNLINLCRLLQIDLSDYDFSGLPICQAHLQGIPLQQVNFAEAEFSKTTFTQTFGSVLAIAFSPDSSLLATGDANGQVRIWSVSSGQLLLTLQEHQNWVWSVAFSPDGSTLATGSYDQTIKLWDTHSGICLNTLRGHTNSVLSVAWSPDGTTLASGSSDYSIRLWHFGSGACIAVLQAHQHWVRSVAWSPNGKAIASSSDDHTIRLWDPTTQRCTGSLTGHQGSIRSVAWSPDSWQIVSGSDDQTVRLWNVETGEVLRVLRGHFNSVRSVAWSADGGAIASGSYDQTVRIWDAQLGNCLKLLQGHNDAVMAVAWSPNGQLLVSGSYDHTVKFWDLVNSAYLRTLRGYSNWVWSLRWSPDGSTLASGSDDHCVRLWQAQTGRCTQTLRGHQNSIRTVAWNPNSRTVASGSTDRTVRIWSAVEGRCLRVLRGHQNAVRSVAWRPQGDILASASYDGTVQLWDGETGTNLRVIQAHPSSVWAIAWSPTGDRLASGSYDKTVKIWDAQTGACLHTLAGHSDLVLAVTWSPDGQTLASSSYDQTICLWNASTGELLRILRGHQNLVGAIAWNPDGTMLASGSSDRTARLWDAQTGACLKVLEGYPSSVGSVTWQPDGQQLACTGADEMIQIWDIQTEQVVRTFRSDRPYEGMNISGVKGLTQAQKATLKALGAIGDDEAEG